MSRELHGHVSVDDFGWLRHRGDSAVLEYLEAENRFTESSTAHLSDLREEIFLEIKSRVQETDVSAPARRGKWWYGHRTEEGKQYPIFVRWPGSPEAPEEVYLDQNLLAAGQDFCAIGLIEPARDQDLIAYSVDHSGNEAFELRFRSLVTGEDFPDRIESTYYGGVWSTNAEWFFYTTIDEAHRPYRLWRHRLGTAPTDDILVWQEDDERFFLEVGASRDERFLIVHLESSTTSETRYLATGSPEDDLAILLPRVAGVRYQAEPSNGEWLVVTDAEAPNGKLISLNPGEPDKVTELIGYDPRVKLARVLPFGRHLVVLGRRQGNPAITVIPDDGAPFDVAFSEPSYRLRPGDNLEYQASQFRVVYESMLTPRRVIDIDLDTGAQVVVKENPAPNYRPDAYLQHRVWVAVDGVEIPITFAHREGARLPAPTLLYGYGAYESVLDPYFDPALFSLLDRDVLYAVAHVRGGGEMGRLWHLEGRMDKKANTFTDFVASAEYLVETGVTQKGRIAARGVSAGGLLMGAVTTARPDLWAAVVAEVPFVDVINTMLDSTIPLTITEWEEWGNPAIPNEHGWMMAYSPYENTVPADYPAILATAGLNDPRVAFWEPAKWVARLRTVNTGSRPILLKTDLESGHGGPSGRYDSWRDEAFLLSFVLDQLQATSPKSQNLEPQSSNLILEA